MDDMSTWLIRALLLAGPVLLAVTFHELAHGYVANRLGDPTARMAGRLTLNPIKHLDLVGTLVFFITQMIGWAKPVPINPRNFRRPRQDMIWVSLAGPVANLLLALIFAQIFKLLLPLAASPSWIPLLRLLAFVVSINIGLAIFNLIPIPPLDGSHVLAGILPRQLAISYAGIGRYGFLILLLLIFMRVIDRVIYPIITALRGLMLG